jgi:hypothetical protein
MKATDGSVYCWVVWFGPRKWQSFRNRRDARAFRREVNGVLYKLVRGH